MFGSRIAYTACMLLATIVAGVLLRHRQSGLSLEPLQKWGIAIGGLIGATFAAKLPFILGAADGNVVDAWLSDGKTILWGLTGGYIGVELAKWSLLVTKSTGDSFVIPVALAVAIGRVGCLLFGCCYGIATDQTWGIAFANAPDGGSLLRHPTQIYEIAFHLTFAMVAWVWLQQKRENFMQGNWMPVYLIAYALFRFVTEYVRPEATLAAGLTMYQWSAVVIVIAFSILLFGRYRSQGPPDYDFPDVG